MQTALSWTALLSVFVGWALALVEAEKKREKVQWSIIFIVIVCAVHSFVVLFGCLHFFFFYACMCPYDFLLFISFLVFLFCLFVCLYRCPYDFVCLSIVVCFFILYCKVTAFCSLVCFCMLCLRLFIDLFVWWLFACFILYSFVVCSFIYLFKKTN